MKKEEIPLLEEAIDEIGELAGRMGLDAPPMRFEICPPEIIYTLGAYGGMPTRFSHWSFGKAYHRMKTQYDFALSRIYELVINTDPCYAYLLERNSLIQNKLVVAHVYAHADFFKHNLHYAQTRRDMLETMSRTAQVVRDYEFVHGKEQVEKILDAGLSIQGQVDPWWREAEEPKEKKPDDARSKPADPYADLWALDQPVPKKGVAPPPPDKELPEKRDLLLVLVRYARYLEDWEKDILSLLRDEMLYFRPQITTKIANEGWATYWHQRLLRELDLTEGEAVEAAMLNSRIIQPPGTSLNPYLVGLRLFEDIERRYDRTVDGAGTRAKVADGENLPFADGREAIFSVRETENDSSLLRNFLTKELVEKLDLYLYTKMGDQWVVTETDWEKVRDGIILDLTDGGLPAVEVLDVDHEGKGTLALRHLYDGRELHLRHLEKTLIQLQSLWRRTVELETVVDGKEKTFVCDGNRSFTL